jgi:hypothetical protein
VTSQACGGSTASLDFSRKSLQKVCSNEVGVTLWNRDRLFPVKFEIVADSWRVSSGHVQLNIYREGCCRSRKSRRRGDGKSVGVEGVPR